MANEPSEHDNYYRSIHACILAHITEEKADMASFHARFEKHPDNWTRALACGFYRMGFMHLEMIRAADDKTPDFYDLEANDFVGLLFADELAENAVKAEKNLKLDVIRKGFDAVLKYDRIDGALSLNEMKTMAVGLGKLVVFYPPFFVEAQRDDIMQEFCADITEDLLGEWP